MPSILVLEFHFYNSFLIDALNQSMNKKVVSSKAALLMCLVGFSALPTKARATNVFLPALLNAACLQKNSQLKLADNYLEYLLEALRFDSVVGTAFATFFTVALLQLGGIPDPFFTYQEGDKQPVLLTFISNDKKKNLAVLLSVTHEDKKRAIPGLIMWLLWMLLVTGQFFSTFISLLIEIIAPFNFLSQYRTCFIMIDGGIGVGLGAGIGCAVLVFTFWGYVVFAAAFKEGKFDWTLNREDLKYTLAAGSSGAILGASFGAATTNAPLFAVLIPSLIFHPIFFSKGFSLVANLYTFAQGLKAGKCLPCGMAPRRIVAVYSYVCVYPFVVTALVYWLMSASFIFSVALFIPASLSVAILVSPVFFAAYWVINRLKLKARDDLNNDSKGQNESRVKVSTKQERNEKNDEYLQEVVKDFSDVRKFNDFVKYARPEIIEAMERSSPAASSNKLTTCRGCTLSLSSILQVIVQKWSVLMKDMLWWMPEGEGLGGLVEAIKNQITSEVNKVDKPNNMVLSMTLRACLVFILTPMAVFGCWTGFHIYMGRSTKANMEFISVAYRHFFAIFFSRKMKLPTSLININLPSLKDLPSELSNVVSSALNNALADTPPTSLIKTSATITVLSTCVAMLKPFASALASILAYFDFVAKNKSIGSMAGDEAEGGGIFQAAKSGKYLEVVNICEKNKESVHARDKTRATPLHWSAANGHSKTCSVLVKRFEAFVEAKTESLRTPLHWSAEGGKTETCKVLVELGANVNAVSEAGLTPLHYSAAGGHAETCFELLKLGANINAETKYHKKPLDVAKGANVKTLLKKMKERGENLEEWKRVLGEKVENWKLDLEPVVKSRLLDREDVGVELRDTSVRVESTAV